MVIKERLLKYAGLNCDLNVEALRLTSIKSGGERYHHWFQWNDRATASEWSAHRANLHSRFYIWRNIQTDSTYNEEKEIERCYYLCNGVIFPGNCLYDLQILNFNELILRIRHSLPGDYAGSNKLSAYLANLRLFLTLIGKNIQTYIYQRNENEKKGLCYGSMKEQSTLKIGCGKPNRNLGIRPGTCTSTN